MSEAAPMPMVEGTAARRRFPRYQLSVPFDVTVFRPGTATRLSGRSQDVGEGGLRGVVSGAALVGERVELVIALPNAPQPLTMHAVVRHQGELHCGFEFLNLEHAHREQLQRLGDNPALRAVLINDAEIEPEIAPLPHTGTVLCASCGYEFPEDESMCVMCGTHHSKPEPVEEIVIERRPPSKLIRPSMWAMSMSASAAYYKSRGSRSSLLDSVVAVVFLVTLSVGLWQWLNSPADASKSQPSTVSVALENVLLRPIPSVRTLSTPELGLRSSSSSTTRKRKSLLQVEAEPIIGFNVPVPQREPIGQPGSAAAEPPARRTLAIPAVPAQASAATTPREQPATSSLASAVQAAAASATQTTAPPAREAAPPAEAPAPASSAPSGLDLEGMLLQKVLPVYPTRARREGLQGQVVLKAVIGKDGNIAQLLPVQGPQELTQAAIDAVQHWRFRPYQLNGKPVEVETDIRLNFQLPKK